MHEYRIQIILAVLLVFLLYKLLRSVLKKKLEIKYVLSWIIVDFCLLIIDLFPSILTFLCKCLGIQLASNMIFPGCHYSAVFTGTFPHDSAL